MITAIRKTVSARMLGCTLAALFVTTLSGVAHSQVSGDGPARIAVVNLERVVSESPQGKQLAQQLGQFQESVKAEGEQMAARMRDIQGQLATNLSAQDRSRLESQLQALQDSMRQFQSDKQREGQKMQTAGLQEIEARLAPVFAEIQEQYGFDLILNNVPGIVVNAGERMDITQIAIDSISNR